MDLFAVVETWHDGADSPCLIACTPPYYKYIEKARTRSDIASINMASNHGGICVFFKTKYSVKPVTLPEYKTMEVLLLSVRSSAFKAALLTVYRRGSEAVTNTFFEEFSDLLERCASFAHCVVVGDINVHLDCRADTATRQFRSLLDNFGLTDCVNQPTHNMHHQLDVFITRTDQQQPVVRVDPPLISDHSLLIAEYDVSTRSTPPVRPRVRRRKWRSLDVDNFCEDIMKSELASNPPNDVNEYFNCYDHTLSDLLDKHVPAVYVTQYARPASPWFDTECHLMKVRTRKLEKQYRQQMDATAEAAWREQFKRQRILFQSKFNSYWKFAIDSSASNSKVLWSKLRCLLQSPTDDASTSIEHSADDFSNFFVSKIDTIRQSTAAAPHPTINSRHLPIPDQLTTFRPVTSDEVTALLKQSPAKHCTLDPIPTWLLKRVGDVVAPIIAAMCNASFTQHNVPNSQKKAIVHPLLKKPTLDPSDLASYRPISNLSFVSKTLERLVSRRLTEHTDKHSLLPSTQSAYRAHHSTETALLRIHNDLVSAIDQGDVCALVLLDLSAAFDTVDHAILIDVLRERFGVDGDSLSWMMSYLADRSQVVSVSSALSSVRELHCGVPQGSVLGPKQFTAYTEDVVEIFAAHSVAHHGYADDTQCLARSNPAEIGPIISALEQTVSDVGSWCDSRRLQLNPKKTEMIWFGTPVNLRKLDYVDKRLHLNGTVIEPVTLVRNLGVYFDSELSMCSHVSRVTRACYYQLRRLRSIRRQLGRNVAQQLVSAFVLSRLDYCNSLLADLPATTLAPLQRVQNAAARLVLDLKPSDHITAAFIELHWLPIKQRIAYKLCLLVHKSLHGQAPIYLSELLHFISDIPSRSMLRSAASEELDITRTRLCFGDRAFRVAGPRQWNLLPAAIRSISNTVQFKRHLKTYLFHIAFNTV